METTVTVAAQVQFCVTGFTRGLRAIEARLPDGTVRPLDLTRDASGSVVSAVLEVAVLDPLGAYLVTATEGSAQATARVTVTLPPKPLIVAFSPTSGPPGTIFRFGVAATAPDEVVQLDVYTGRDYLTTVSPARTDASGRVVYGLATDPADPLGEYCLAARPARTVLDCTTFRLI